MTDGGREALLAALNALPDFRDRDDRPWPWVSRSAVHSLLAAAPSPTPGDGLALDAAMERLYANGHAGPGEDYRRGWNDALEALRDAAAEGDGT